MGCPVTIHPLIVAYHSFGEGCMRRAFSCVVLAATICVAPRIALSQADEAAKQRNAAIEKGIGYLKKTQATDGSWDYDDGPFHIGIHMKQGTTALCALALMKSGVAPDAPEINKAFEYILAQNLEHTYSVGCVLMALEARFNWEPPHAEDGPTTTGEHGGKKLKPGARDLDLAKRCVEFLVKNQSAPGGWSYPRMDRGGGGQGGGQTGGGGQNQSMREDLSNTQYALLGLEAAERLGIAVPKGVYEKSAEQFVQSQEKDGPEVAGFPVPGADMSYKELKKVEKELHDKIKQIDASFKGKKDDETNAEGHTAGDERRTVEEDAARKILRTVEGVKMHARGWNYTFTAEDEKQGGDENPGTEGRGRRGGGGGRGGRRSRPVTGSMTTAGLACLFICKAHLDGVPGYEKALKAPVDRALRDGAAWIARDFSVTKNPGNESNGGGGGGGGRVRAGHLLYYLYGLERAGVLLLVPKFGEHDWYVEGAAEIVKAQNADGSWDAKDEGTVGPVCDTCFSLLFLARGTTPIVRIPTRTATGSGKN
jgi:hypothetical protein